MFIASSHLCLIVSNSRTNQVTHLCLFVSCVSNSQTNQVNAVQSTLCPIHRLILKQQLHYFYLIFSSPHSNHSGRKRQTSNTASDVHQPSRRDETDTTRNRPEATR